MTKIVLVERNSPNYRNDVYIEYVDDRREKPFHCSYTIGSKKSEAKLYGPTAKNYKLALKFAGVTSFDQIPYGASYTEPQQQEEAKAETSNKVIIISGKDFAPEGGEVVYPAERLPREDFDRLYKAGAMYHDSELDAWVINPDKAKALGYTCKMKSTGTPAGWGFRD